MLEDAFAEPLKIARLMADFPRPWAFCGGWAIDLFLGRVSRAHKDVDIAVFRRDQAAIRLYLAARGWTLEIADAGTLSPWEEGRCIELPMHVVWCKNPRHDPDFLEVLFNETDGARFLFRPDQSVTLDLDRALLRSPSGLPILAPEVALLYKARHEEIEENSADFHTAVPHLDAPRRAWLRDALTQIRLGHPWLGEV